jgi:hypothetical protein
MFNSPFTWYVPLVSHAKSTAHAVLVKMSPLFFLLLMLVVKITSNMAAVLYTLCLPCSSCINYTYQYDVTVSSYVPSYRNTVTTETASWLSVGVRVAWMASSYLFIHWSFYNRVHIFRIVFRKRNLYYWWGGGGAALDWLLNSSEPLQPPQRRQFPPSVASGRTVPWTQYIYLIRMWT